MRAAFVVFSLLATLAAAATIPAELVDRQCTAFCVCPSGEQKCCVRVYLSKCPDLKVSGYVADVRCRMTEFALAAEGKCWTHVVSETLDRFERIGSDRTDILF